VIGKVRFLESFSKFKNYTQSSRCDDTISKISYDLMENLGLLEERQVLFIVDAARHFVPLKNEGKGFYAVRNLTSKLNQFVTSMAEQQPDLVEAKFLVEYLARVSSL